MYQAAVEVVADAWRRLLCPSYAIGLETRKAARACLGSVECRMQRGPLPILGKAGADKRMAPSLGLFEVCKNTGRDRSAQRQFVGKHKQVRGPGPVGEEAVL